MEWIKAVFRKILGFFKKKDTRIGIYGPPNSGKTTLSNRICSDWLGEEMGSTSKIAHETRQVMLKEKITIKSEDGKTITFSLADTPGIATRIDYQDFVDAGLSVAEAKQRAKEAKDGVIQSIEWLSKMDCVLVVLDSTKEPFNQVNSTIISTLEEKKIKYLIVANKIDLKKSNVDRIKDAFPQAEIMGISAKSGENVDRLYLRLIELVNE